MTRGEQRLCDYLYGRSGDFFTYLFKALFQADRINFEKLKLSFKEEAEAVYNYSNQQGYWEKLKKEYKDE